MSFAQALLLSCRSKDNFKPDLTSAPTPRKQPIIMARTKKKYSNGTPRGGVKGLAVVSSYGAPGNYNKSKKNYPRIALGTR